MFRGVLVGGQVAAYVFSTTQDSWKDLSYVWSRVGSHGVHLHVLEALSLVWYIVGTLGVEFEVQEMGRILKNLVVSLVSTIRVSLVVGAWIGNPWCDQCPS